MWSTTKCLSGNPIKSLCSVILGVVEVWTYSLLPLLVGSLVHRYFEANSKSSSSIIAKLFPLANGICFIHLQLMKFILKSNQNNSLNNPIKILLYLSREVSLPGVEIRCGQVCQMSMVN